VENPFNAVLTFTAFRDAAPPEAVALYRDRESISYRAIEPYHHEGEGGEAASWRAQTIRPTTELVENLLLEVCPTTEEDFLHMAAGKFGVSIPVLKPYYVDAMSKGAFVKTKGNPAFIKFTLERETESWEAEHGLPEKQMPEDIGAGLEDPMFAFDGAGR
jgi:hypothetical protein